MLPMEMAEETSERGRQAAVGSDLRLSRGAARQASAAQFDVGVRNDSVGFRTVCEVVCWICTYLHDNVYRNSDAVDSCVYSPAPNL
jgi:hypothetical protein